MRYGITDLICREAALVPLMIRGVWRAQIHFWNVKCETRAPELNVYPTAAFNDLYQQQYLIESYGDRDKG